MGLFILSDHLLGKKVNVREIGDRSGFYPYEAVGIAWLETSPAHLYFQLPQRPLRLRLEVYRPATDYPLDDTVLRINGFPLQQTPSMTDRRWATLETAPFLPTLGQNKLSIEVPFFVPADMLDPNTKDTRKFSLALGSLTFSSQD